MPAKGTRVETGHRHFGVARSDSEFRRDDQLLFAARICCRSRSRRGKRFLHDTASVAVGAVRCASGLGILATASRQAVFDPRPHDWERDAVDGPCCRGGNDSVSAGNCRTHCRQVFRKVKKQRLIGVAVAAILVLLAGAYLWGPGSAPRGQEAVVTLSEGNVAEFENAFDTEPGVPRLVLLLSPT